MRFLTFLSLFFYAGLSLALGLGNADLKSNLGEKFLAKISVTGFETPPDVSCFSAIDAGDAPAFKKTKITLDPNNGSYQLTISTNEIITEPIVNLRLTFHCDPNMSRDYTLLLDPAPLFSAENPNTSQDNLAADAPLPVVPKAKQLTRKHHQAQLADKQNAQLQTEAISAFPAIKPSREKRAANMADKKLLEAYTGKQTADSAATPSNTENNSILANPAPTHTSTDKPFLVISADSSTLGANKSGISLRLATEIDTTRPDEAIAPQAASDAMDEVTVMTNRLAHLEKQVISLQARNVALATEAKRTKEEAEHAKFNWLQISKIALLTIAALGAAEWLRRRLSNKHITKNEPWFADEDSESTEHEALMVNQEKTSFNAPSNLAITDTAQTAPLANSGFNMTSNPSSDFNKIAVKAPEEEHSSAIDDADVFIEHGRPLLAIQLLQSHLNNAPSESPAIWFKLLDILSSESSEADYNATVAECGKYFNIKAAPYGTASLKDNSSIEDYPHIITRLEGVWGSQYAFGLIDDLIFNKRSQPREGLGKGAFDDLFFLKLIAKQLIYANPPEPIADSEPRSLSQATLNNAEFNNALFTDLNHTDDATVTTKHSPELNTPVHFTPANEIEFHSAETHHADAPLQEDALDELMSEPLSQASANVGEHFDDGLEVEEIDISAPLIEKAEHSSASKTSTLNEDLILKTHKNAKLGEANVLEFSLDFPTLPMPKMGVKSKVKGKSSGATPAKSNEIEWDLPESSTEPKLDK